MAAAAPAPAEVFAFGPFETEVTAALIAAYGRATAHATVQGDDAAFVFPVALALKPARPALAAALAGYVAVHESQSVDADGPIAPGRYIVRGVARRTHTPERLMIEATVETAHGVCAARLASALRLFARAAP